MSLSTAQRTRLTDLHSNLLNDVTDDLGIYNNVIPCKRIKALWSREPVVGTAHTIQTVEIGYRKERPESAEDIVLWQALDAVGKGDFVVRAAPDDVDAGLWGELLSTAVEARGAVGALVDGPTRDSQLIEQHQFPVWSDGQSALESFGRVDEREYDIPVEVEGVTIRPGDIVFADYDSTIVLPPDELDQIIEEAERERALEDEVREELREGRSLTEIWDEYETL